MSETGGQFPFAVEVRVRVTLPLEISVGPGLYVAFKVISSGVKFPSPLVAH